ncbi:DNA translocase FtsK [Bacillus sp. BB56-3]|uniref:DNA translocase FtsK n=1 Tax=Bacillus sp. BB56-3 TaxID=2217831 RepID=UPI0011ED1D97|nr:DNA translocase FtsK [Bacillus sp. BB56-3]KAA0784307.1 cell division protein FtsK [Bacillus sp. BB56-3]
MIETTNIDTLVNHYYETVKSFVTQSETISLYEIDREFQVGHVVAAYIIDRLETEGIIASYETCLPRKVLVRK